MITCDGQSRCSGTGWSNHAGEVVAPAAMVHRALLARLYVGVATTRCQSERNVSSLSVLFANTCSIMGPFKVEQLMLFADTQRYIPEIAAYNAVIEELDRLHAECSEATDAALRQAAGIMVAIDF